MAEYSSYYKYQKYVTYHTQNPLPNIPLIYSVDGNGTMPLVLKNQCDPNCGCTGDTHDYSQDYLTFRALEDGTFKFSASDAANANKVSYSLDNGNTWVTLPDNTDTPTVTAGSKIMWKGSGLYSTGILGGSMGIGTFSSAEQFEVEGNIMSLLSGDSFSEATTVDNYQFYYLFKNCRGMTSAENLILPATTLAYECYMSMFETCTNLTKAPSVLPATTLATSCYSNMFYYCTSLTTAPELPATTLANGCYNKMFSHCYRGLTTAPELPATTLAGACYSDMFAYCSNLTKAPTLPATTLAVRCYDFMFQGCTSLTAAPELPATTLAENCYRYMFENCRNINYIKAMFTTTPSTTYTSNWVSGVASSGTFVKNASAAWDVTGVNGIPTGWTVIDA